MTQTEHSWFHVENVAEVPSPSLLVFPERVEENIRRMIRIAGGVERLRPHMKTHKMPEVIRMQMAHGITKFKCATIAEAEMTASAGAEDVLLAYQPVGPNVDRFLELAAHFSSVRFSCVADNPSSVGDLSDAAARASAHIEVLIDLDIGQHRTGIAPDSQAFELYRLISSLPALKAGGLHAYDGHIHDAELATRTSACEAALSLWKCCAANSNGSILPSLASLLAERRRSPSTHDAATSSAARAPACFGTPVTPASWPTSISLSPRFC
jgi:D-serine deaminase-like pyridoxal phosphate-dependent protein